MFFLDRQENDGGTLEVAADKNEIRFGKHLASSEKRVRDRTVSLLREWLHHRSKGGVLTDLDLLKVCAVVETSVLLWSVGMEYFSAWLASWLSVPAPFTGAEAPNSFLQGDPKRVDDEISVAISRPRLSLRRASSGRPNQEVTCGHSSIRRSSAVD